MELGELRENELIVIKPADEGSVLVIMDHTQYLREAERQLSVTAHYVPLEQSIQAAIRELQRLLVTLILI